MAMPYQQNFWGYVGGNVGESKYNLGCPTGNCGDKKDTTYKIYAGGKFNNALGLEIGYIDMGEPDFGSNSQISARGLNFSGVFGFPIGTNSSVFAKLGGLWGRTKLTAPAAVNVSTGKTDGWGWSGGLGALIGFTPQWGMRLDIDRYQFKFASAGHDTVDTATIGLQYSFR